MSHMQDVYHGVLGKHASLDHSRQQIDQLVDRLNQLSQASSRPIAEQKQRAPILQQEQDLAAASQNLLSDTSPDLPSESSDVQQAVDALLHNSSAADRSEPASEELLLPSAVVPLRQTLATLRSGVDSLDEENFRHLDELRQLGAWKYLWEVGAFLTIMLTLTYAIRLYRQLRREELARFEIESELSAERRALEERVKERTCELETEAKERRRSERLNRGYNRVLEMLTGNGSSAEMLKALADTVAEFRSTWFCAVHLLEDGRLKLTASSGMKEKLAQHLRSIPVEFTDAVESSALAAGSLRLIKDLSQEHKTWSELLRANGVQSVWSAPFFAPDSTPLGTLTVYALLLDSPSPAGVEMIEMSCQMAAMVLERRRLQSQLIEHAYHDSLTGLPNRRLGEDRLSNAINRAIRSGHKTAILWIDLNKFKYVNDQYGHPAGDAVLQQAANRLSGRLRASDTLARMGGDEFMVILQDVDDRQAAEQTGIDLLDILARPMQIEDTEISITASIGISLFPEDGASVDTLALRADRAMYAAKYARCGVLSYTSEMDRGPVERREIEAELVLALETGGFTLAYQPQCLPDGTLVGLEALLRFHSDRLGDISPSKFIPVAEETGLIVPIGEWVLREVCRQSQEWRANNHMMVPIAVNVSAIEFDRDDFADMVARILEETGQTPSLLVLELTESIVMHDISESTRQMNRLKKLGVHIAIDDFGTGYSSLSYLHRLPIDMLKIDRSFIENLNEPEGTHPIVEAVLTMAHALGYRVVAEGVETEEQLSTLQKNSCDIIQGFLFSRPLKPLAAAVILKSGKLESRFLFPATGLLTHQNDRVENALLTN
ncbi:MAG: putative bifunctional diguanylate cyclase/phosphodiesterase [Acidobacteriaceae bacterium]